MIASFLAELNLTSILFRIKKHAHRDHCYEPTLLDTNTGDKLEWIQIEFGGHHTVGLTKNGKVFTWGLNGYGQLGHGDRKGRSVPTKVESLDELVITNISCGGNHSSALTDKGEILTWYVLS
jgi:alpha-tubulin suppressor-like RCC1 family protein